MECCCIPRLIYTERRTTVGAMLACAAVHTYPLQGPYIRGRQIFGNLKSLLRPGALSRRRHLRQYMYDYSTMIAIFSSQSLMWGPFGIKYIQGSSGSNNVCTRRLDDKSRSHLAHPGMAISCEQTLSSCLIDWTSQMPSSLEPECRGFDPRAPQTPAYAISLVS